MAKRGVQRRRVAIMACDAVGYTRLVEADEAGTLARFNGHLRGLISPALAAHQGRLVKTTGDGLLAEFENAADAVRCAVAIQEGMAQRERDIAPRQRLIFRVGINLGEVVDEGGDIFGEAVNLAARLEQIADPGGILVSASVREDADGQSDLAFEDMGVRSVKNVTKPVQTYRVGSGSAPPAAIQQEIRYCTAADGVQLAFATTGTGAPLVKAPNWLNHLEYDWESRVWRHLLQSLAEDKRLVRFDARGTGLSDREVPEISFEAMVGDLEAVIDAAGLERFALLGISQGCAISIAYAARHPERVSHLVLLGGFAVGWRRMPAPADEVARREAMTGLVRSGWGQDNPAFRQFFTSLFIPEGTTEQMKWFNDLQRESASPENAARIMDALAEMRVAHLLRRVETPALVLHARGDGVIPFEAGRFIAETLPNARFIPLESRNHLLLEHEPAWPECLTAIREFLRADAN